MKKFLALSLSDFVFILLINVKMPTVVGILTFMSRITFMLSWVEYEKSFITLGPVCLFGLWFNTPDNSSSHIQMVSKPNHTFPGQA